MLQNFKLKNFVLDFLILETQIPHSSFKASQTIQTNKETNTNQEMQFLKMALFFIISNILTKKTLINNSNKHDKMSGWGTNF